MTKKTSPLDRLEDLVSRAGSRLQELHEENAQLRERVATLESEARDRDEAGRAAEVLENERAELVERVENLVDGLDELLSEIDPESSDSEA